MADKVTADCTASTVNVGPLSADEQAQWESDQAAAGDRQWTALRADRDARLTACDWTQLTDTELTAQDVEAWGAYRQQLRDLPDNTTDPANPDWPEPPPTPAEETG